MGCCEAYSILCRTVYMEQALIISVNLRLSISLLVVAILE